MSRPVYSGGGGAIDGGGNINVTPWVFTGTRIQIQRVGGGSTWIGVNSGTPSISQIWMGTAAPTDANSVIAVNTGSGSIDLGNATASLFLSPGGARGMLITSSTNTVQMQSGWTLGGASGAPMALTPSTLTLGATGTTSLTAAQQGTPVLRASTVTLTGNITIDFGGVVGQFWLNLRLVTVGANTITLKNGTGTQVVTSLVATSALLMVDCDSAATIIAN